jgi:hypothetical protein
MSDVTRRIERWQKKYSPAQAKATLDQLQEGMRQRYEAATVAMTAMELKTKEVLNQQGVHTTNYVPYLSYARQLWKLSRQQLISGESFKMASQVLLEGEKRDTSLISSPKRVKGLSLRGGGRDGHLFREASGHLGRFRPPI